MNSRIVTSMVISDAVKDMVRRQVKSGWTSERIAYEMQKIGHEGWNATTPVALLRPGTRALSVDEALGLLAVFRNRNRMIAKELERLTTLLTDGEGAGNG